VKDWLAPAWTFAATLLGAAALTFLLVEAAPGDFLSDAQWHSTLSPDTVAVLRERYGLDRPWHERAVRWLAGILQGDWGHSLARNLPVWPLLRERAASTLLLALAAQGVAWTAALALGFAAARRPGAAVDRALRAATLALLCVPEVVLALLAMLLLLAWVGEFQPFWPALAALTLAIYPGIQLQVRTAVAEAARASFVEAARLDGVRERTILLGYLLPAMAPALLGYASVAFGSLLGASLLIECVTAYPGLGPLLVDAVFARDLHVVAGAVLLSTALWSGSSLLADLLQRAIDPRPGSPP
jgi:peptide/nickel transport system permease protein